uniref:ribosome silencing factor n=1 Tax=Ottowia beijingensis TaxID=1207057 RepID=UPI00214DB8F7|nr:ribosome silencing factor [Ottowia beijingensis]
MSESAAKKDIQKLQRAIVDGLEDVKAHDIRVFNTEHLSPLFERVIVASGSSNRQTKALAASVRDKVREGGFAKPRTEGEDNGEWIIVDCGAAVAHIMQPAIRQYYNLEEIWGEKPVRLKGPAAKAAAKRAAKEKEKAAAAPAKKAPAATKKAAPATAPAKQAAVKAPARKVPAKQVAAKSPARKSAAGTAAAPRRRAGSATAPLKTVVVNKPSARSAARRRPKQPPRPQRRRLPGHPPRRPPGAPRRNPCRARAADRRQ